MPTLHAVRPVRKRPGRYHHGDLRQALIQSAVRTIDRQGVEALTLRAVGASLGVSRSALYRHFSDKDSLLVAVAAEGFRTLHAALVERWQAAGQGLDGFRAQGHAYVEFGTTHPAHYRVMFGGYVAAAPRGSDLAQAGSAAFTALVDALSDLQHRGVIRQDEPRLQARYVWATVHGVTMLLVADKMRPAAPPRATFVDYTIDRIVGGLRV